MTLSLELKEVELVLQALAQLPYITSKDTIEKILLQARTPSEEIIEDGKIVSTKKSK